MINLNHINGENFENHALDVFKFQYNTNSIYRQFCESLKVNLESVRTLLDIPFLPVQFFKTHEVVSDNSLPEFYFESSGTGNQTLAKHYIKDIELYHQSIELGFKHFFCNEDCIVIGLLPHYLERPNSSLVYMVRHWMKIMNQKEEFFLYNLEDLAKTIQYYNSQDKKVILIGISFALLDLCDYIQMKTENSQVTTKLTIIETGGMKGKRPEMLKEELIGQIQSCFPGSNIISEYGMCELLSQAYSDNKLNFSCPPWMKVFVSEINDALSTYEKGRGIAKIIDLANVNSCSFIETQDLINLNQNGSFQIKGRVDNSDVRGCSLMYN